MTGPVNVDRVAWKEWKHSDEIRVRFKPLHDEPDAHVGVCIQELSPGCSTRPAHYHLREEEHVYVLRGEMMVRLGQKQHQMREGDYVCFRAGDALEHCLINPFDSPCEYLLWGERNPDDVIVYPDSNKVGVKAMDETYVRDPKGYWDGEGLDD